MVTETFSDSGTVCSWRGSANERVELILYDESQPLKKSSLTLTSDGGVCVFASPPRYADPEVIVVQNWNLEIPQLVERQGTRHAFIGGKEKVAKLGTTPKYTDI